MTLFPRSQGSSPSADPGDAQDALFVEIAFAAMTIPVAFFVRRLVIGHERASADPEILHRVRSSSSVILEGVSMFGLVVLMLGQPIETGLIVPAIAMGLQASRFPVALP